MALVSGNKSRKQNNRNATGAAEGDVTAAEGAKAVTPADPTKQPESRPAQGRRTGSRARAVTGSAARETQEDPGLAGGGLPAGSGAGTEVPVQAEACATSEERAAPEGQETEAGVKIGSAEEVLGLVETVRKRLFDGKEVKPSVADFIRLLQLYREMAGEAPREITVRWIDRESLGR